MSKIHAFVIILIIGLFCFCSNASAQDDDCPKYDFACKAKKCSGPDDLACMAQVYSPVLENYCNKVTMTVPFAGEKEKDKTIIELSWENFKYNKASFYFGRVFEIYGQRYSNYADTIHLNNILVYSGEIERKVDGQNMIFQYSCWVLMNDPKENAFEVKRKFSVKLKNNEIDFASQQ